MTFAITDLPVLRPDILDMVTSTDGASSVAVCVYIGLLCTSDLAVIV